MRTTTSAAFSTQATTRNSNGVRLSPSARITELRKLNATVATAPLNSTVRKTVAAPISSGGVPIQAKSVPEPKVPIRVMATAIPALIRIPAQTERRTAAASPAPNALATGIARPAEAPIAKPNRRNWRLPEAPTAARASTPSSRPTTMASVTAYSCWNRFPTSSGRVNMMMRRTGGPTVRFLVMRDFHEAGEEPVNRPGEPRVVCRSILD